MEIDLFFAKFEIPRDKEISQQEMRQKLLTNFNMTPEQGNKLFLKLEEFFQVHKIYYSAPV